MVAYLRSDSWSVYVRRAAVATAVLAVTAAVLFWQIPICPAAVFLHQPCPGCGMTRSVLAAADGDFAASFQHHPLGLVVTPFVMFIMARNAWGYLRTGRWGAGDALQHPLFTWTALILFVALMGLWIARFLGAFGGPEPV